MRKILCVCVGLLAITLFASCEKVQTRQPVVNNSKEHTILVYMIGDDLTSFFDKNIRAITNSMSANRMGTTRVLIYRQYGSRGSDITEVAYNPTNKTVETNILQHYPATYDAAIPDNMVAILNAMAAFAPAERYGLIMGSHGFGWIPAQPSSRALGAMSANEYFELQSQVANALPTRWFGIDGSTRMETPDIAEALKTKLNFKPDYLIFDACYMASIEALYDFQGAVDYIIASPCEVMAYGFPYQSIMSRLNNSDLKQGLFDVVNKIYEFYSDRSNLAEVKLSSLCLSLTDCSKLGELAAEMKKVNAAAQKDYESESIQRYDGMVITQFFDLGQYVELSCANEAAVINFKAKLKEAFPAEGLRHTDFFYSTYNASQMPVKYYSGVTTNQPSTTYLSDLQKTKWWRDTH